jgi:deubiquitinating protein VCIP135
VLQNFVICFWKELLQDFINASEWDLIIEECDPDYMPEEAKGEILGLRNIHVFGLANIVKRPIILLDSAAGMNCSGDYSGKDFVQLCGDILRLVA